MLNVVVALVVVGLVLIFGNVFFSSAINLGKFEEIMSSFLVHFYDFYVIFDAVN